MNDLHQITVETESHSIVVESLEQTVTVELPVNTQIITRVESFFVENGNGESQALTQNLTASIAISGQRAVADDGNNQLIYADSSDASKAYRTLGISKGAGVSGALIDVLIFGELIEAGWNWTPNQPIFFDSIGNLTQIPPTTGFVQRVGRALSPTKIYVTVETPIFI